MSQVRKDVLNGWKEIAGYLGRDTRTVERWEKQRGLPVHRLPGSGRATIYALVGELDAWMASTPTREAEPLPASLPAAPSIPEAVAPATPYLVAPLPDTPPVTHTPAQRLVARPWGMALLAVLLLTTVAVLLAARSRARVASTKAVEDGRWARLVPSSPVPGVEELYLRGCFQQELRTPDALRRAQEAFTAAIGKDARYAPAYAGLASTYILLREYTTLPDEQAYQRAWEAAQHALALDPDLPQAHAALGFLEFFARLHPKQAEEHFGTALRLDANLPLVHHWYGSVLLHEGRFGEALHELEVAQRLDPSSAAILTLRAYAMGLCGRREEAVNLLQEAIRMQAPATLRSAATMHNVLASLSLRAPQAVPRFLSERMLAAELREDTAAVQALRRATESYRRKGEAAMWEVLLREEGERTPRSPNAAYNVAVYTAALGRKEEALDLLGRLVRERDTALVGLSVDPVLATMNDDPRLQQLRLELGLSVRPH